jgi:hypothetical protein
MSVQEWIYWNAARAEIEPEGRRALRALDGIKELE